MTNKQFHLEIANEKTNDLEIAILETHIFSYQLKGKRKEVTNLKQL